MILIYLITIFLGTFIINLSTEINNSYHKTITEVPHSIKCAFEEVNCEKGNLVFGDILQFGIFFILGRICPNHYNEVIFLSILFEIFMFYQVKNMTAKFIISPLIKITAYSLGTQSLKLT